MIDTEELKSRVNDFKFSGRTRKLVNESGSTTYAEITPTVLQRVLMHYRDHPKDETARAALPAQVLENIEDFTALLPPSGFGWWKRVSHKSFRKPQKE